MQLIFICTKAITFNTFLKTQANFFLKKGLKVRVACSDVENLNYNNKLTTKIDFPSKHIHLINFFQYFKAFLQIKKLTKNNKSSIFYLHTPVASHIFRLFTFFQNLKIIYFVHGFRFTSKTNFFKKFFFKLIEKILSMKTNIFITINEEDYNYAKYNLFNKPTYKIKGIGLNLKKISRVKIKEKKDVKKIIVIGAYKKSKGYTELLKIAESLKTNKFKIDCYGYGDFKKFNYTKLKNKLDNITFNKFDVNLKNKINRYDILIHLSNREGLPVAVMECLSKGIPVICKEIRGNKDLITNAFNGYFIKSYKEVPNKIFYLNLNKTVFNKMRANAIKSITKNFSNKNINKKIFKIIEKNLIV